MVKRVYSFTGLLEEALNLGIAGGIVVDTELVPVANDGCSLDPTIVVLTITLTYDDCEGWVDSSEFYWKLDDLEYAKKMETKIKSVLPLIFE